MTADALAHGRAAGLGPEIGRRVGARPGPTLILIGGMHGNEPAGVEIAAALLERIGGQTSAMAGELCAFAANRAALAAGRRYIARDLNRQWTGDKLAAARARVAAQPARGAAEPARGAAEGAGAAAQRARVAAAGSSSEPASGAGPEVDAETVALVELADALDQALARARGPVFALDLHTTSAAGIPFAIVGAGEANRAFAARFPLPGIVGLLERVEGVLTDYLSARGCAALAIEGGQHDSVEARENLAAAVTIALAAAGLLLPEEVAGYQAAWSRLGRERRDLPQLIEVVARHEVRPEYGFRMEPGFTNLQRTRAGTLLARANDGEIRAPFDGLLLLPLYQREGSDGFFYGRELA